MIDDVSLEDKTGNIIIVDIRLNKAGTNFKTLMNNETYNVINETKKY